MSIIGPKPRTQQPRRYVVAELRLWNELLREDVRDWTSQGTKTIYDATIDADPADPYRSRYRRRQPGEYPEHQFAAWDDLARDLAELSQRVSDLYGYALIQRAEAETWRDDHTMYHDDEEEDEQ